MKPLNFTMVTIMTVTMATFVFVASSAMAGEKSVVAASAVGVSESTSIKEADCNLIAMSDETSEIDFFKYVCPGPQGYLVKYLGGDSRSWVGLMAPGEAFDSENSFFGPMMVGAQGQFANVYGPELEWRSVDGKLVALIALMMAQDPVHFDRVVFNFVVIRLDTTDLKKACWVGSVESGAGAGLDPGALEEAGKAARVIADDLTAKCL